MMSEPRPNKLTAKAQARPFGKAAFEYAKENKVIFNWEEKLSVLAEVIQDQEDQLLHNPGISVDTTREVMERVMDKMDMSDPEKNFINLLIDRKKTVIVALGI